MDFNSIIGNALRIGVIISAIIIIFGVALLFLNNGSNGFTITQISNSNSIINSSIFKPSEIFTGLPKLYGLDYIYLGLMVLIATPVLRVLLGIAQFASERNKLYTIITIIIFFNLMFSIFILPILISK
jgi:Predicted membrane protein